MSRNRDQGTHWEQFIVKVAQACGLKAWPLARRGPSDPGDLAIQTPDGDVIVVEARCRQNMSVHRALAEARDQTDKADLPFVPLCTVLAWKRLQPTGGERRRQAGP